MLTVVQAGNVGELLAAMMFENLGIFLRDFLERLQAVGRKPGRYDRNPPHTVLGQSFHGLVGVGLKPLVRAEARLKRQQQFWSTLTQALAQAFRRRDALAFVRIALV